MSIYFTEEIEVGIFLNLHVFYYLLIQGAPSFVDFPDFQFSKFY